MSLNQAGIWWSYAKADPSLLAVVVLVVALAAIGFVGLRVLRDRAHRRH